jgi:hypothetical protein
MAQLYPQALGLKSCPINLPLITFQQAENTVHHWCDTWTMQKTPFLCSSIVASIIDAATAVVNRAIVQQQLFV